MTAPTNLHQNAPATAGEPPPPEPAPLLEWAEGARNRALNRLLDLAWTARDPEEARWIFQFIADADREDQ